MRKPRPSCTAVLSEGTACQTWLPSRLCRVLTQHPPPMASCVHEFRDETGREVMRPPPAPRELHGFRAKPSGAAAGLSRPKRKVSAYLIYIPLYVSTEDDIHTQPGHHRDTKAASWLRCSYHTLILNLCRSVTSHATCEGLWSFLLPPAHPKRRKW